jgi:NHLM bacteriocin system ABC transporter ATP-binding protein
MDELARIQEKAKVEEALLDQALKEMAALLNPEEVVMISPSAEPLFQACQHLGNALNITFINPQDLPDTDLVDVHLAAICEASEIRQRRIALKTGWWRQDGGDLLGFYGPENHPVALLNTSSGCYEMIDPVTQEKRRVTASVAKELSSVAYTFYRPLPESCRSGKDALLFFCRNHFKELPPLITYGVIASLIALFPSLATGFLFNNIIPDANHPLLTQIGLGLLLAAISTALFAFFNTLILVRVQGLATHDIQAALWDRLLKLPVSFFRKYSAGNLILRVMSPEQIRILLTNKASKSLLSGLFSLFFLIAMALFSLKLTLVALVLIAINALITAYAAKVVARLTKELLEIQGKLNGVVLQLIAGVAKLRIAGAENSAFSYWASLFTQSKKIDLRCKSIQTFVSVTNAIFPSLSLFLLFYLVLSSDRFISVGTFLAFYAAFVPFSLAIFDLSNTCMLLTPIPALWERSKPILAEEPENLIQKNAPGILQGKISIDDVVFSYDKEGPTVLNQLSLHIHPGEFVAILGPSGCGKSTIVRLLLGFEKPRAGAIYFDDKDLQSLNVDQLRRQIGVVLQEGGITFGSIYDNITCGGIYSQERVEKALELSGFNQDLDSFPMGLHTVLPMGGATLSGGQKQRLLIARALLPNPKILILDEATSTLDNRTQDEISHNIDHLNVTRIVIAHRLSTIRNANRIYVMEKGKIAQTGTFAELAALPGPFANMLARQKL